MTEETERILLSGVLFNTGDPNKLDEKYFTYYPKAIAECKKARNADGLVNPLKVARGDNELKKSDISAMNEDYFPYMFEPAYKEYLEFVLKSYMKELSHEKVALLPERLKYLDELKGELLMLEPDVERVGNIKSEYYDEIFKRAEEKFRMTYGIPTLDRTTGGLKRNEFVVLAARPSVGKSAFAMQIAEHVALNASVLFISCEMSRSQIMDRRILRDTTIDFVHLKTGRMSADESKQLAATLDTLKYIHFLDKTYTLNGVKNAVAKYKPDLLIIDYITLLRNGRFNSKREEIASITRELKLMSISLGIAIIGLAQVNRGASDKMPTMSDLKESGTLEEDADVVIILHRPSEEDKDYATMQSQVGYATPILVCVDKNRNGATGKFIVGFNGNKYTFTEPYRRDDGH